MLPEESRVQRSTTASGPVDRFDVQPFVEADWYSGYTPGYLHGPWVGEPLGPFRPEDADRFWILDGHSPTGCAPLEIAVYEDIIWGQSWAAQLLHLPATKGFTCRLAGAHIYSASIPTEEWERPIRAEIAAEAVGDLLADFRTAWDKRLVEIVRGLEHFENVDLEALSPVQIGEYLSAASEFHRRCWEIHFEMMYALIVNYFAFRGLCSELGVPESNVARMLQGEDTKFIETDRLLLELSDQATAAGIADLFIENDDSTIVQVLKSDSRAAGWWKRFHEFLGEYGWRTESMANLLVAPWIENPIVPLGIIRRNLTAPRRDFTGIANEVLEERRSLLEETRSRLTLEEQRRFDEALEATMAANFAWWQEDHDFYIDLRAHLPFRRAAIALGRRIGAERADDCVYLFRPEFFALAAGELHWEELQPVVRQRRAFHAASAARRRELPSVLGNVDSGIDDPVMLEVFGIDEKFIRAIRAADTEELVGIAASSGVARGPARIVREPSELKNVGEGEILVCEYTSPNWTSVFGRVAGCVSDTGGVLSHTAIVCREYRVPCVTGTAVASRRLVDGDLVEIDGDRGIVRLLERASS